MKRLAITAALVPVGLAAVGYGFGRQMAGYFTNLPEVADRMAVETLDHFERYAVEVLGVTDVTHADPDSR